MMNLLRRIATLPGIRNVLLQPTTRRRVASAAGVAVPPGRAPDDSPARFVAAELVTSRGQVRTWPLRAGGTVTLMHRRDLEAFHELMVAGEYEPPAALTGRLEDASKILDIGGNIGMFAHWARRRWPAARITSFEPDPENLAVFRAGLRPDDPIELVEAAAATQSGHAVLASGSGAGRRVAFTEHPVAGSIPAVDIFDHLADADFVKMDIEGGEWPILADPRLADLGATWVIEFHRAGAPSLPAHEAARNLFEAAGYTVGHQVLNYWGHGTLWAWKD